jgi:replicative DNA helicase
MSEVQQFQKIATGDYVVPIKDACQHEGQYAESYQLGYDLFDNAMKVEGEKEGGVRNGDLIIITGKSGEGKTTFMQNIALHMNNNALPCLFFSYEVTPDNIYAKFKQMGFSDEGVIFAPKKIITGNTKWIKEKIIEAKEKYFVKNIFIDHIDFLTSSDNKTTDQLRMRLKHITQELKTIALEEEVIIFLIAHTKKVENREIEMQDISESSGIYQLADFVFSVARDYDTVGEIKVANNKGLIKLLKNRLTGEMPYYKFFMNNNIIYKLRKEDE